MRNIFTHHPKSIDETYSQHFKFALLLGGSLSVAGLACMIHAIFPFMFQKTASNILFKVMDDFVKRMPVAEERFVILQQTIQNKMDNS